MISDRSIYVHCSTKLNGIQCILVCLKYKGLFCSLTLLEYQPVEGATFCMTSLPRRVLHIESPDTQPDFLVQLLLAFSVTFSCPEAGGLLVHMFHLIISKN